MILHFRWNFIASLNLTFIFHSVADSFSGGCYCESSVAHFGQSCKISGNCCKDFKILLSVRKYFFSRESSVSEFATAEQQEMFFFLFQWLKNPTTSDPDLIDTTQHGLNNFFTLKTLSFIDLINQQGSKTTLQKC